MLSLLALPLGSVMPDTMWVLGPKGLDIYNADGTNLVSSIENTELCLNVSSRGTYSQNCGFRDAKYDHEHGHVWATNTQGGDFVELFDTTGSHLRTYDTCGSPWTLDIYPPQEEVWVHCWSPDEDEGDMGHVDIFSMSDLDAQHDQVALVPDLDSHGHGQVVADETMPHNSVYATLLDEPNLFKIDSPSKKLTKALPIEHINGLYRTSYSKTNQHLFMCSALRPSSHCVLRSAPLTIKVSLCPVPGVPTSAARAAARKRQRSPPALRSTLMSP